MSRPPSRDNQVPRDSSVERTPVFPRKKKSGGGGNRKKKFTEEEINYLLETIERLLPIGPQEWEIVNTEHNKEFSTMERDKESLRRKFGQLVNSKVPTGDPLCPPDVRWAKQISKNIEVKADSGMAARSDLGIDEGELSFDEDDNFVVDSPEDDVEDVINVERIQEPTVSESTSASRKKNSNADIAVRPPFVSPRLNRADTTQEAMSNYIQFMMMNREQDRIERQREREDERRKEKEREEERKLEREERRQQMQQQQQMNNLILLKLFGSPNNSSAQNNTNSPDNFTQL